MQIYNTHEILASTFRRYTVERQDEQYPETIIIVNNKRNIEVIYLDSVIVIQENGINGGQKRNFIWCETEPVSYLIKIIRQMIKR